MKWSIPFLLSLLFSTSLWAQANVYDVKNYMSLTDEVHLIRVFIDTDYGFWEEDEMAAYDRKFDNCLNWLADQAFEYDAFVEFNLNTFEDLEDLVDLPLGGYGSTRGIRDKVIKELGFEDVDDLLNYSGFDMDNDKLKMVVFVKSNSRSHAQNYWSVKGLDIAVVYCNNTIGMATTHLVMAHEVLHLFGAWDLYKGERQSEEKAAELMSKYPHSVMINTWRGAAHMNVDELTAWRVGWAPFNEEYMKYKPQLQKPKSKGNTAIEFKLGKRKKKGKG